MVIFHSFLYVYQAGYGWVYWHWLKLGYLKIQVSKKSHLSASKKCQSKIVRSHFGQPRKSYWLLYIYPKISYTPMIYTPHDIISIYTYQCILIVIYTPWYPKLLRFSTTPFPGFCFKSGFQSWPGASPPGSSTQYVQNHYNYYRMGPPVDSVQLVYNRLISMVYGRYNELVHGDYHGL